jgi:hypothetical protein
MGIAQNSHFRSGRVQLVVLRVTGRNRVKN